MAQWAMSTTWVFVEDIADAIVRRVFLGTAELERYEEAQFRCRPAATVYDAFTDYRATEETYTCAQDVQYTDFKGVTK